MTPIEILRANAAAADLRLTGEPLEVLAAAADGSGRRLRINAYNGGAVRVPGHSLPIVADLSGLVVASQSLPILFDHRNDSEQVLGVAQRVEVKSGRIDVEAVATASTAKAADFFKAADAGLKWQASIGARVLEKETIAAGQSVTVNGRNFRGPLFVARRAELIEVSVAPFGADPTTSVAAKASGEKMNFEDWLKAKGFDAATLSNEQTEFLRAAFDADNRRTADGEPAEVVEARRMAAAEYERQAQISRACGSAHADLCATAIRQNWTVDKTRLEVLQRSRPTAPSYRVGGRNVALNADLIQAAACVSLGGGYGISDKFLVDSFGAETINAAAALRGLGLRDTIAAAARLDGVDLGPFSLGSSDFIRAAFSTVTVPDILSNLANKSLLAGRTMTEGTWERICSISSNVNFKKHTRLRLNARMKYEKVNASGELKDASKLGSEKYETQLDTYGLVFSLSRQMIIDDDMGAFAQVPNALGIGSVEAINEELYKQWLANAGDFFGTGNGNLLASTALVDFSDLDAAQAKFKKLKDALGNKLRINPAILFVPGALEATARNILFSQFINQVPANNAAGPMSNPAFNRFRLESSSYLDDEDFADANGVTESATAWYLLADPNITACYDVAFLNGQRLPTIERLAMDGATLGMSWRCYHDFGVAQNDPKAGVKVTA